MLHIQVYRARRDHARLGRMIDVERGRPRPDELLIVELKRLREQTKAAIADIEARQLRETATRPAMG